MNKMFEIGKQNKNKQTNLSEYLTLLLGILANISYVKLCPRQIKKWISNWLFLVLDYTALYYLWSPQCFILFNADRKFNIATMNNDLFCCIIFKEIFIVICRNDLVSLYKVRLMENYVLRHFQICVRA